MIRLCSEDEALSILNETQIQKRLGVVSERVKIQPWIAFEGKYKMLFFFWWVEEAKYELHIACPKSSIIKSRVLSRQAIDFIFNNGADVIITNCPEGKIANMARKVGMTEIKNENKTVYFEVKKWALAQQ